MAGAPPSVPASPYKGLLPFEDSDIDAMLFFGRDTEREIITANLKAQRLTVLYGPSGVGKSSVLRAAVVHDLRLQAERDVSELGAAEFAVAYYANWLGDPAAGIVSAVEDAVTRLTGRSLAPGDGSFDDGLARCAEQLDGALYIVLDQMEEYFLYHGDAGDERSFPRQLARALSRRDLPVAFLLSVREDALASLDAFKRRIPNLFGNMLRLDRLDYRAARAAIVEPIARYNSLLDGGEPFTVEDGTVAAVLEQIASGQVVLGERGRGTPERGTSDVADRRFETPYLQLVMQRIWDEEQRTGSRVLRRATLDRLGGAERIVRTHLDGTMRNLRPDEQQIAARAFRYLVTPSNTKVAYTADDLAEYAEVPRGTLAPVLEELAGGDVRILRTVAGTGDAPAFEIFHDALGPAVLDWRSRYLLRRRQARLRRLVAAVACLVVAAVVGVSVWAFTGRSTSSAYQNKLRGRIVAASLWAVRNRGHIGYTQGSSRLLFLIRDPYALPLELDTSTFIVWCYWIAGAPNPNGSAYSLSQGVYTGTLLAHMKHISRSAALPGDVVIWTPPATGWHAALVEEAGADPMLVSHGSEEGPTEIRFSRENARQSSNGHGHPIWLTIF